MSLQTNLSWTFRRLAVNRATQRTLSASARLLTQNIQRLSKVHIPRRLPNWNWNLGRSCNYGSGKLFQLQGVGFHSSTQRSRGETRIDESLNRLDTEIRRVGRIRRQEVDEILEDIKEMKKATSSQSLMIIRCCGELIPEEPPNSRTELVRQVWQTLENLNVPMDVSHYNALLRVYLENEHKFNPTEFLQDLTSKGIEPNRVTYQRLIARFCQDGDIDGASTILQHMKEKQLPINEYVFNSLILGHGQANDMESAEGILTVMAQAGLEPNDDTHVTLMTCYAKHGDIKNIHRIAKECEEKEIFLIDRDFLNMIAALAESNHDDLIDEILPYLKKHSGFNQEATNLIFRLTNMGHDESAYKILKQMTPITRQGTPMPSGNFVIKHLIHLSKPSDVIVKFCRSLKNDGLNEYALSRACEFALIAKNFDLAMDLIQALQQEGLPIRQHYIWPVFAGATSEREIYTGLKYMRDLGLTPNLETLREYIIPKILSLKNKDETLDKALSKLSSVAGITLSNMASSVVLHLLSNDGLSRCVEFASMYRLPFGNVQIRRAIVDAYLKSKDATSFVKIIASFGLDNPNAEDNSREYIGMMLMEMMSSVTSPKQKATFLEPILKELLAYGLGLSNSGSELLQNHLGEALTPELANTIIQLTSSELTPKISLHDPSRRVAASGFTGERSTPELEAALAEALRTNGRTTGIKKALFYNYCREKDVEKVKKLQQELMDDGFVFTSGMHAMLLELHIHSGDLEGAKTEFTELQKGLDSAMDDLKILRYAHLLQTNGDEEGCMNVLKNTQRDENRRPQGAAQQAMVWKLLNCAADSSPEKVKNLFDVLIERKLMQVTSVTLGPLIKAYLVKDDLAGALTEFERCVQEHKTTPWKQELFCRFIKLEDAERLQKVMDLSTNIHGEVNSMYDLVFAFIDCGKLRQAKKILETPGLRARNDKIEMFCQRYFQEDRVGELENLIQVTKDLMDVDRNAMYFYLLQAYCKQGDADKALSIWTTMQEENVQPSVELLIYLADFLRKSNRQVPFVVPDASEVYSPPSTSTTPPSTSRPSDSGSGSAAASGLPKSVTEFRRCIDMNDIDKALQIKQRLDSEGYLLTLTDRSHLIEKLSRAERLNEATRLTQQMLEEGNHPLPRTLRFLTTRLASAGDVAALEQMESRMSDKIKDICLLNSRLCIAYVNANRGEEYFQNKIKKTVESAVEPHDSASSSESSADDGGDGQEEFESVSVFGCMRLLAKNEHLVPEFEELSKNAHHQSHKRAMYNALWAHYMFKKEFARAKEIWQQHLNGQGRVLFRNVVMDARANNDTESALEAWSQIMTNENVASNARGVACACALDALGATGKLDEALSLLEKSLTTLKIEDFPVGTLLRLKEQALQSNKPFSYVIPAASPRRQQSLA